MMRSFSFFFVVGFLVWVSVTLTDYPGLVTLEWAGWRIDTSITVLLGSIVIIAITVALAYRFLLFLRNTPKEINAKWLANRRERGYEALTRGMVAVAAGDANEAQHQASRASTLLDEPPLTLLISAQAAQMRGDEIAAIKYFNAMVKRSDTEFLGLRGLYNQAIKRDDKIEALSLARRAYRLEPKSTLVINDLFNLQISNGQWLDAGITTKDLLRRKLIAPDSEKRIKAVINYQLSEEARDNGDLSSSDSYLQDSIKLAPSFIPAAVNLAISWIDNKNTNKAKKMLEKSWTINPHPALLSPYWLASKTSNSIDKVRVTKKLISSRPDHHESLIAIAQVSLEAQLWGEVRQYLEKSIEKTSPPSSRVCRMMAELEESENANQELAHKWLVRSSQGSHDPVWVCNYCGDGVSRWSATRKKCGEFDNYYWRSPPSDVGLLKVSAVNNNKRELESQSRLINVESKTILSSEGIKNS
jgi:HemY protein